MSSFELFAQPWWVNAVMLVPIASFFVWRKNGLAFSGAQLAQAAIFGAALGFIEASVVVYLRAATGLLPGYEGALADVWRLASDLYRLDQVISSLPQSLFTVELFREAATMILLVCVALLAAKSMRERLAMFLWIFAAWDIFYYAGLWVTVRWPASLTTPDVLFLIPVLWISQVWFPILVSALTMSVVLLSRKNYSKTVKA